MSKINGTKPWHSKSDWRTKPGAVIHGHCSGGISQKWHAWHNAKSRCYLKNHPSYPRYGGRGIRFYTPWLMFENFDRDMPDPPSPAYSLERKDPRQGYTPENCTWATREEQARNKRNTVVYEWRGHRGTLVELARIAGISFDTAYKRFRRMNQPLEVALETPVRKWERREPPGELRKVG